MTTNHTHIYRRRICWTSNDSLGKIIKLIPLGATVLDLGTATGYLCQFLKEELNCLVDGVEINPEMAKEARLWCDRFWVGNLEAEPLSVHFPKNYYQVIICADILEHLYDPNKLLQQLPALLAPDGKVIFSIPNITYAGVILELLSGDFYYREEGLLDKTHLRFFTRKSFVRLLKDCGFNVDQLDTVSLPYERSEFSDHFRTISQKTIEFITNTPSSDVYQYVIVATPTHFYQRRSELIQQYINSVASSRSALENIQNQVGACHNTYDILISIYNAYEQVRKCIENMIKFTDPRNTVYLLDDASSDPRILPLLVDFSKTYPWIKVLASDKNMGYVANINRGLFLSQQHVVILNSDAFVSLQWLERMEQCLYSHPAIGIVSPLSNNATILSVPVMNLDNCIPDELNPDDMANLVAHCSSRCYPRIPTAVGFCMLIKRQVLESLGEFDAAFTPGYGEECDFSMRAWRVGFEIACCDDAYVYHKGGASFGAIPGNYSQLLHKNQQIMHRRWPQYHGAIAAFCRINPLRTIQERLEARLYRKSNENRPKILHVLHRFGNTAGTELHTQDLLKGMKLKFRSTIIYPDQLDNLWGDLISIRPKEFLRIIRWRAENATAKQYFLGTPGGLSNKRVEQFFARLLVGCDYDIVHFHNLIGWDTLVLPIIAKSLDKKVVLSLHDYFLLCPDYNLVLPDGSRCGKSNADGQDEGCLQCLSIKTNLTGDQSLRQYLLQRFTLVSRMLESIDLIIAPSHFMRDKLVQAYGDSLVNKIRILPHGISVTGYSRRPVRNELFKVAYVGFLHPRKGAYNFIEVAHKLKDKSIVFSAFGSVSADIREIAEKAGIQLYDSYQREDLLHLLESIDLVVIPSAVDESFCLTLSEVQALGVPVLATKVGAISERIIDGKTGFLIPGGDTDALANRLLELATDPNSLVIVINNLKNFHIKTISENIHDYVALYNELLLTRTTYKNHRFLGSAARQIEDEDCGGQQIREFLGFHTESQHIYGNHLGSLVYRSWISKHSLSARDINLVYEYMANQPSENFCFHLLIMLNDSQKKQFLATLNSLLTQLYPNWQLTVVASSQKPKSIAEVANLNWIITNDDYHSSLRILNQCIINIDADWVGLIPAGIIFEPHTLFKIFRYINLKPDWGFLYTDEDRITTQGERYDPQFKPDLNLDLLRSMPYMGHLCLVRRNMLIKVGSYAPYQGLENYDIALKILELAGDLALGHIPEILLHKLDWDPRHNLYSSFLQQMKDILAHHLKRQNIAATIHQDPAQEILRVEYLHENKPSIAIIVRTKNEITRLKSCLNSIIRKTDYPHYKIFVVDGGSTDPAMLDYFKQLVVEPCICLIRSNALTSWAGLANQAAEQAQADYLLLLNDAAEIVQEDWIERLLEHGQRQEIGIVGGCSVSPDDRLLHTGLILGLGSTGVAGHYLKGIPRFESGYMAWNQALHNCSAVPEICLLIRKSLYLALGGMDENCFPLFLSEIDLCLKATTSGYKIVWTPHATIVQYGPGSAGEGVTGVSFNLLLEQETLAMYDKWLNRLGNDPAYNRNLSLKVGDGRPEIDIDVTWDSNFHDRRRILAFPHDKWGSGEYRVRAPVRALHQAALADCALMPTGDSKRMPTLAEIERVQPDTLLLHNSLHDYQLRALQLYQRYGKAFRVFSQDDLLTALPEWNPYHNINPPDMKERITTALSFCDRLVVTTLPLAEHYRDMIDNIVVVANRLERARWGNLVSRRRRSHKPRIGWAGAGQHQGDLELLIPIVIATAEEAEWVFFGMCPEPIRPYIHEHYAIMPFTDYPDKLAGLDLDLAVAPLEYNVFNEAKSNLRLLEYGILGWPVVCTDIYPYQSAPVARVPNTPKAWIEAIRQRIYDLDATAREGDTLQGWVLKNWIMEDHLEEWLIALTP